MEVYLLLGSNLGDRKSQIRKSIQQIEERLGTVLIKSSVYETESWGIRDQPAFLNQAVVVDSDLEPGLLLEKIKDIELSLGRSKRKHWQSREIDIDILFYGEKVINTQRLTIPHPHIPDRMFALVPLLEIASELVHPVEGLTISELYDRCIDPGTVAILEEE